MGRLLLGVALIVMEVSLPPVRAQTGDAQPETPSGSPDASELSNEQISAPPETPDEVSVSEVVGDSEIGARLRQILTSTEWFRDEDVVVENGVVFLTGATESEKYRTWAGDLASRTEDVVAVVNRIRVAEPPILDLNPAWTELRGIGRIIIRSLPLAIIALAMLALTWMCGGFAQRLADRTILRRIQTKLLREVFRKVLMIPVLLLGLFFVLRITGLTQLAVTVLGGTGRFGLVIGIAFRDIAENFLSSILLSMQNPFQYGDLIEVAGQQGFVQRVNTRGTLLMTTEGNHVQIPNSQIYKGTIVNFTSNPNRRFTFVAGIGYDVPLSEAQDTALQVLTEHPAVLDSPEPQVLVEELGSSSVILRFYAWCDTSAHAWTKVRSSVMRLVLKAFADRNYSMPDDSREIVFPQGVPVHMVSEDLDAGKQQGDESGRVRGVLQRRNGQAPEQVVNRGEGDLSSDAADIRKQAETARDPEQSKTDLLAEPVSASN
ncbi:MAG: mechanosensitive ion channel [Planctomycetaceae bacterium]|nr:mechanosensitive ion channel [Planctomycetaceae bacterium]